MLFHDDLSPFNESLYLHEFVARASRHGLRYLADSDFSTMHPHRCPPAAEAILAQTQDRVEFEQYLGEATTQYVSNMWEQVQAAGV